MADSNITKRALAAALKELMETHHFAKISVSDICEKCDMNRKSFYYHFKDKYDLVNWIYDTEFIAVVKNKKYQTDWELMEDLCTYFYVNREFYLHALKIKGQNSFSEHFRELLLPLVGDSLKGILGEEDIQEFYINFFADAITITIERWILNKDCVEPKELIALLKSCLQLAAAKANQDLGQNEEASVK